ncbi:MAG: hypothetical protein SOR93_10995 [Clostridiales Family XIII bacterium]|nr:hypothetical protein [Clostridia bacterium]MDY3011760.1 hypothetical protein [Clostridiales Family XIII bacterium]
MAKMTLEFEGFDELIQRLNSVGKDTHEIAEKSLRKGFEAVTPGIASAIAPHRDTGQTEGALVRTPHIKWQGTMASVDVGFDIPHGGIASVFLMFGTPKMAPDCNLYNSVYGAKANRLMRQSAEEVLYEAIRRAGL